MVPFVWNAFRLARLRSAVRAHNAAITRKAKELADAGMEAAARFLPEKVTVEGVKKRVRNVNDFRRIVGYKNDAKRGRGSELTRVLKSYDPNALEFVEQGGTVTTRYQQREDTLNRRAIARQRRSVEQSVSTRLDERDTVTSLEDLSEQARATFVDGTDLRGEDEGEYDDSVVDVDEETLNRWRSEDYREKRSQVEPDAMVDVYLSTWKNPRNMHHAMSGYQQLIDDIEWLLENDVARLNKAFASGRDEVDVQYIVDSGKNNPYLNIDYEVRHNRAVRFWREVRNGKYAQD